MELETAEWTFLFMTSLSSMGNQEQEVNEPDGISDALMCRIDHSKT